MNKIGLICIIILIVINFNGCVAKSTPNIGNEYSLKHEYLKKEYNKSIVLIHGLNSNSDIWTDEFKKKISDKYQRNIYNFQYPTNLFDLSGVANSYEIVVNRLKSFIDKNMLNDIVFICHSQGGIIAEKYILNNISNNHTNKLVLLGTPSTGSFIADYTAYIPFASEHMQSLKEETKHLLILQENISHYQNTFPKTLVILGSNDIATSIENGFIGFKFAKNYQVPLSHSQLYEFEKYKYLYDILDDFIMNDFKNYKDNIIVENDIYIRFPQLSDLKYEIKGTYKLEPLTNMELNDNGYEEVILSNKVVFNNKEKDKSINLGYGYTTQGLTHDDVMANNLVASDEIMVPLRVITYTENSKENRILQSSEIIQSQNNIHIYKYQHEEKIERSINESLWCRDNGNIFISEGIYDFNILAELDYMTIFEIKNEISKKNRHCIIEKKTFSIDKYGRDRLSYYIPWLQIIKKAFRSSSGLPKVDYQKEYEYLVIKDVPIDKEYNINLTKLLNEFLIEEISHRFGSNIDKEAYGFDFNIDKKLIINLKVHKGKNYRILYVP